MDDEDDEDKEEKDESKKLRELIDTINMKESLSDGADPLDILSDLKGDDDETKVLGAKDDFMKETTKEAPVIRGLDKLNLKEETGKKYNLLTRAIKEKRKVKIQMLHVRFKRQSLQIILIIILQVICRLTANREYMPSLEMQFLF